jgi:hypothetical protein
MIDESMTYEAIDDGDADHIPMVTRPVVTTVLNYSNRIRHDASKS